MSATGPTALDATSTAATEVARARWVRARRALRGARWLKSYGWLLPVAAVVAIFWFTLPAPFLFDDEHDILDNAAVHRLWPPKWAWVSRRPVVMGSFALNWAFSGRDPAGYRLLNIAVLAGNAALLSVILRRALRGPRMGPARAAALGTAVALLWAVHPLHTTVVAYVVHRYESIAAFFLLGSLAAWQAGRRTTRPAAWFALSIACSALAILSKEIAIVGPVLLAAYDWAFPSTPDRASKRARRLGLVATWAVSYGIAASFYPLFAASGSQGVRQGLGRLTYFRAELGVLVHYLRLTFAPHPLSIDYFDWPVATSWLEVLPAAIVVGILASVTIWACFRRPRLGWAGLAAFAILAPTSTFLPLYGELFAERRMLLPSAAVLTLTVLAVSRIPRWGGRAWAPLCLAGVLALGARTVVRNGDFSSAERLYRHDLTVRPKSVRLVLGLASVLARQPERKREALETYLAAERLSPAGFPVHGEIGSLAAELGDVDLAARRFGHALAVDSVSLSTALNAATFYLSVGHDLAARSAAERAARLFPTSESAHERLAWVLVTSAECPTANVERAKAEVDASLALSDGHPGLSTGMVMAATLAAGGNFEAAAILAQRLADGARRSGAAGWADTLDEHIRAYRDGHRWVESGRAKRR